MIGVKLPPKARSLFRKMAVEAKMSEDELAFEILMEHIEDFHDAQIIAERMKDPGESISLEDVMRNLERLDAAHNQAAE